MIRSTALACIAAIAIPFLSGCGDADNVVMPERGAFYRYTVTYNTSNPYNWYGEQHNAAMAYGFSRVAMDSMTQDTAIGLTADFMIQIDPYDDYNSANRYQIVSFLNALDAYDGMSSSELLDSLYLTSVQRSFMSQTLAAINQVAINPDTAIARLNSVENAILASSLTNTERAFPLLLVAISKHSTDYWLNDAGLPTTGSGDLARIRDIINRDAAGCLKGTIGGIFSGGLGGFIGGSILGPAGTAAGAAGGAIIGGIVGGFGGAIAGSL